MKLVENQTFDQEREFYGSDGITVKGCVFDGEADGESAFKESKNVAADGVEGGRKFRFSGKKCANCPSSGKCFHEAQARQ